MKYERSILEIISEIVNRAMMSADFGWTELIINYYVDDQQSDFGNSFLVTIDGSVKEKALPVDSSLDSLLRDLRKNLGQNGHLYFSSCKLHVHSNGKYEITYGYEPVDWDALVFADWNFFPTQPTSN